MNRFLNNLLPLCALCALVILICAAVTTMASTSARADNFTAPLVHLRVSLLPEAVPGEGRYELGQALAAQLRVREHLAHGQHISLRLEADDARLHDALFWAGFVAESGDTWLIDGPELTGRVLRVLSHVHVVGEDSSQVRRLSHALEQGGAAQLAAATSVAAQ